MGNVRSLGNKMDELAALVMTQREYREYFASVKLGCTRTPRTTVRRFLATVWYRETETV